MNKKIGLREAVNDMCKQCLYDKTQDGTWRSQVESCTSPGCPLYSNRPVPQATTEARRKQTRK